MASPRRSAKHTVSHRLRTEPYRFSFVQAVRLWERIGRQEHPPRRGLGGSALPTEECVSLGASPSLSFPPTEVLGVQTTDSPKPTAAGGSSAIANVEPSGSVAQATDESQTGNEADTDREVRDPVSHQVGLPPKLTVGFMGLFGPSGVLPQHDTQRIINAGPRKNPERDFLDIFNHRILSLFFRASTKYRLPLAYEAAYRDAEEGAGQEHLALRTLFSMAGMGTGGLRGRLEVCDELAIEFSGLFRQTPKNASSLQRMLAAYFDLPFHLQQFVGQWLVLSEENKSAMPSREDPLGRNCALGSSFLVGDRVWDISGRFRLRIGPLDLQQFESFLPETPNLIETAQLTRWYVGNQFDFDVQLELLADCVPEIQLGGAGQAQLGFNTWLITEQPCDNKLDAVFSHSGLPVDRDDSQAA